MKKEPTTFNIVPMSGGCGAEVSGVNLSEPMEKKGKKNVIPPSTIDPAKVPLIPNAHEINV